MLMQELCIPSSFFCAGQVGRTCQKHISYAAAQLLRGTQDNLWNARLLFSDGSHSKLAMMGHKG